MPLLAWLEYTDETGGQIVTHSMGGSNKGDQRGEMNIVPAGVHVPVPRGERYARLFHDPQAIQLGTYPNGVPVRIAD